MKPTSEEQPVVADNEGTPDEGTQSNGDDAPIVSTPVAAGLCAFLIAIGIALEVVWWYSNKHHGFASFPFTNLDPNEAKQFLKSFIPSLVLHPIVVLIGSIYLELHRIQPLTRNTSPYQSKDPIAILPLAISRRHWALAVASVVFLWSGVFHPLAGALFTVRPTSTNSTITVVSAGSIGFNDVAFGTPASFISAAGVSDPRVHYRGAGGPKSNSLFSRLSGNGCIKYVCYPIILPM
ncbi:hypothetical protein DL93DRAFT_2073850 [Clavulina sp. PMI_390]|nr:hypothetical protein DL93DRAFT_2073850 [Clavulina sp. PMI_390]